MSEMRQMPRKPPAKAVAAPENRILVSRDEAASLLSISPRAIDYLIASKQLVSRRIGARVLVLVSSLREFSAEDHPKPLAS